MCWDLKSIVTESLISFNFKTKNLNEDLGTVKQPIEQSEYVWMIQYHFSILFDQQFLIHTKGTILKKINVSSSVQFGLINTALVLIFFKCTFCECVCICVYACAYVCMCVHMCACKFAHTKYITELRYSFS